MRFNLIDNSHHGGKNMKQAKFLLALALLGSLVACGGGGGNEEETSTQPSSSSASSVSPTTSNSVASSAQSTEEQSEEESSSEAVSEEQSSEEISSAEEVTGQYLATEYNSPVKYKLMRGYSDIMKAEEWSVTAHLEEGYEFMFFSTEAIDATWGYTSDVYPTTKSNKADGIGYTLSADVQNGNYTDTYLEALNTDEDGDSLDDKGNKNGTYWKYTSSPLGKIRVKQTGTYNIYINIWDQGGWLQIYASLAA